ncbi:asparagine synthase (glutamine-hydrolyzing) [Sulfuricurvum sp. IAE1]|nr:asparagine synthase (glutamine-hydrolyzing) [Sulfuricurvum sp. IAE1]
MQRDQLMCGICGAYSHHENIRPDRLRAAINTFSPRGPDHQETWSQDNVGLGHARLAILDLDAKANQPMTSRCGRYVIVYNGEIYNFQDIKNDLAGESIPWHTHSDTEVILEAYKKWGTECLNRFNGMFAFAIWDKKDQQLFCARDRMGKKPFYYALNENGFYFASRPSALFEMDTISKEIDLQALRIYFEIGYIPGELSIYRAVKMLPPAHYLIFKNKTVKQTRYWDYRQIEPDPSMLDCSEDELLDELDELLVSAVKYRLIADVPVGTFLSGGIDSSLVTAIAAKLTSHPLSTFSIGFNEPRWDESVHAANVARHLKTNHFTETLDIANLIDLMPTFVQNFDEPFFDSSAFPTMAVSRLARHHVTVSLTGDGADELFGGYHYYNIVDKLQPFYRFPKPLRSPFAHIVGMIPSHKFKLLSKALQQEDLAAAFAFSRSISKDFNGVLDDTVLKQTSSIRDFFSHASAEMPGRLDPIERSMRLDAFFTLPDDYLQKVDIASMAFSLETRSPFLDYRIVEWAARLPSRFKVRNGVNKYLLRKLAYRYVPQEILDRPKQGFGVPVGDWIKKDLAGHYQQLLSDSTAPHLNKHKIRELLEIHTSGKRDIHPLLWAIYTYLLWEKHYD